MPKRDPQNSTIDGSSANPIVVSGRAGVTGPAIDCYLRMNGFNTHSLERQQFTDGCCADWARDSDVFDYCIEGLPDSDEGNEANQVWLKLDALVSKAVKDVARANRLASGTGDAVEFCNRQVRLQAHMLSTAPDGLKETRSLFDAVHGFLKVNIHRGLMPKPSQKQKASLLARILPSFPLFLYTGATSSETFATRINHPFLVATPPILSPQHSLENSLLTEV